MSDVTTRCPGCNNYVMGSGPGGWCSECNDGKHTPKTPPDTIRFQWAECSKEWMAEIRIDGRYWSACGGTKEIALVNAAAIASGHSSPASQPEKL